MMSMSACLRILRFAGPACAALWSHWVPADEPVDFARDIRPILAARCFGCHGEDEQESGLRLDRTSTLLQGGNSGPAVVAGNSALSRLIKAVAGDDKETSKMPPEGPPLEAAQIALLKRWIDEGAKAPADSESVASGRQSDHWAFQPLARVEPPAVGNPAWVRNPIDAFVLARLEAAGLKPSPEADKATLVRRASLDLVGLPPTIEQVDAFLADAGDDAYERMVDRLLSSPHYGENWGRHWLDLARYADSNGYTIDSGRSIWKYRDWVIDALNRDLPFDQFTIEQLAGDMLDNPGLDQQIATGFHRNTMVNEEGGTDEEQFRVEAVVDRINTTGAAFLGLTLGCARCHDHKYDPISQREFYQVFAIFNGADEPSLQVPTDQQAKETPALVAEIKQTEERLAMVDDNAAGRQADWESRFTGKLPVDWTVLDVEAQSRGGATFAKLDDGSILVGGEIPSNDDYTLRATLAQRPVSAVRIEVLTDESLPNRGPGLAENGNFVLSELVLKATGPGTAADGRVVFDQAVADYSPSDGMVSHAIDGKPETGWNIHAANDLNQPRTAIFFLRDELPASARELTLSIEQHYKKPRYLIGRFRVSVGAADREALKTPSNVQAALAVAPDKRTKEQSEVVKLYYQQVDPERTPLTKRIAELKQQQKQMDDKITTTLVMRERQEPRETFIHLRGNFLSHGARVEPGVPAVLPPIKARGPKPDRLDFARWLVDPANPLSPRVTVNRIWQRHFGAGLVATENDFGLQGDRPTHPELLDWLARELIDSGWSLKAMHRLIVSSNTYRQESRPRALVAAADPYNKLLGRQRRLRLEAETIRDSALAASGLLAREIGGPGVYPPQPQGIYAFTQQKKFWGENKDADRYRRGMYIYLWRSSPYPFLKTFDVPDAVVACTCRARSNTPLQALALANDRAFFEFAQGFAARLLEEDAADDRERIGLACRRALARGPSDSELASLLEYLQSQRAHFAASLKDAADVAPAATDRADPAEAAAWTMLARVLLNLDEFVTRE
ncbi:MAG: PSD1 and planctomycete cytochrome C domain-containing protein [Pirellulales bacterium]